MRALYLSLFLMIFFLSLSVFQHVTILGAALEGANQPVIEGQNQTMDTAARQEINELKEDSTDKMAEMKNDPGLTEYFSVIFYGVKVIFSIIGNTIRYIVWIAPLLMKWGVPTTIAAMLQTVIYILYLLSLMQVLIGNRIKN